MFRGQKYAKYNKTDNNSENLRGAKLLQGDFALWPLLVAGLLL